MYYIYFIYLRHLYSALVIDDGERCDRNALNKKIFFKISTKCHLSKKFFSSLNQSKGLHVHLPNSIQVTRLVVGSHSKACSTQENFSWDN